MRPSTCGSTRRPRAGPCSSFSRIGPAACVHLIHWDAEVIGYVVLTFGFSLEFHGRAALLDELYVREQFRGRGAGKASLQWIEAICRREGVHAVRLEVERANTHARAVYRQAGYVAHDRYVLTKWLETV